MRTHFITFVLLFISISLNAQISKKITKIEYYNMMDKYAEAITTNTNPELASFYGELGEDDESLSVFVLGKQEGMFWLFVKQGDLFESDTLDFYSISIPDTISLFVYSRQYTSPLVLYTSPNEQCYKEQCNAYIADPLYIIDVCGTWLKIRFKESGKKYEGWIPREEYCSNPYTTCN